ncbi:MAG: cation:proton antiporter, partial [Acutalibacteraceae bacterium]
ILLVVAIATKVIGCGLGAKICKFSNKESLNVGIGMVTRGEVVLVVAQQGAQIGLISPTLFPAVILIVIVTALITPVMLKFSMKDKDDNNKDDSVDKNPLLETQSTFMEVEDS